MTTLYVLAGIVVVVGVVCAILKRRAAVATCDESCEVCVPTPPVATLVVEPIAPVTPKKVKKVAKKKASK